MLVSPLTAIVLKKADASGRLSWAEGQRFFLPSPLADHFRRTDCLKSNGDLYLTAEGFECPAKSSVDIRLLRAFTVTRPTSSRLPFSYQRIPTFIRDLAASGIGRFKRRQLQRNASFPGWPLDLTSDFLADLATEEAPFFAGGPCPVILSHDIDSAEGLRNLRELFLGIEENIGARSANFVVPCGWPIDHVSLQEIRDRGHKLGIHGYDHSNQTAFCATEEICSRLDAPGGLIKRYEIKGYRAPSLLRTPALLKALAERFLFDSSIPTSGGCFPVPENGCASARPFYIGDIIELPLSLPRDGSLLFLGYSPQEILNIWKECASLIAASGGVVVLLTHCEKRFSGNDPMLAIYRSFLEYIGSSGEFTFATPETVLQKAFGLKSEE